MLPIFKTLYPIAVTAKDLIFPLRFILMFLQPITKRPYISQTTRSPRVMLPAAMDVIYLQSTPIFIVAAVNASLAAKKIENFSPHGVPMISLRLSMPLKVGALPLFT
jgi:hypothetical protein